jgi:hypothetical protein
MYNIVSDTFSFKKAVRRNAKIFAAEVTWVSLTQNLQNERSDEENKKWIY